MANWKSNRDSIEERRQQALERIQKDYERREKGEKIIVSSKRPLALSKR